MPPILAGFAESSTPVGKGLENKKRGSPEMFRKKK
eukprot:gene17864-54213_t